MSALDDAMDHLEDAMSDLRQAKRVEGDQRFWCVSKAHTAIFKALDQIDGMTSAVLDNT